jgi:ATP-binding cassette subfamily B protein
MDSQAPAGLARASLPETVRRFARARWDAPTVRGLRMAAAASPGRAVLLALLLVVGAALPALEVVALGVLVGSLPTTVRNGLSSPAGARTLWALAAWGVLMMLLQVAPRLRTAVATIVGWRLDASLRQRAMAAVNRPWGVAHLEDPAVANLISQTTGIGVAGLTPGSAVSQLVGTRYATTLTALTSGALLIGYHWEAAVLLLVVLVVFSQVSRATYAQQVNMLIGKTDAVRRVQYFRDLALAPAAAKEVRLFDLAGWLTGRVREAWEAGLGQQRAVLRRGFRLTIAASLAVTLANGLVYGWLAWDGARGAVGLGALAVYLRAVGALGALGSLGAADQIIAHGFAALPAILELERRTAPEPGPPKLSLPADAPAREIRFENVSFAYPGGRAPVLKGLDLTIPAGSSLALVGLNGAGKTTLVKLLCRLYDPTEGAVTVDGADLRDLDPKAWQRRIAAIFQDFLRWGLPARDNIGFGGLAIRSDQAALDRAAAKAGVLERIEALPGGWDAPLSRHFTGGADLSGGEWQRVALARALFAVEAGAKVLILDEPTANLDVRAEAALYERFLELTKGLTTILISHRFSTVRRADRICVIEGGAVSEIGTHAELVARGGRYAEMFALQSQRFVGGEARA